MYLKNSQLHRQDRFWFKVSCQIYIFAGQHGEVDSFLVPIKLSEAFEFDLSKRVELADDAICVVSSLG